MYPSRNITNNHLEKSRRGGCAGKGKIKLSSKKNCTAECPVFGKCHYASLSQEDYNGKCDLVFKEGLKQAKNIFEFMNTNQESLATVIYGKLSALLEVAENNKETLAILDRMIKLLVYKQPITEEDFSFTPLDAWNHMEEHLSDVEERVTIEAMKRIREEDKAMKKRR